MARKLRIQYAGAVYHVLNRGDRREAILEDDRDRQRFLETVAEASQKTSWQIHAYCLLSNHFQRKGDGGKVALAQELRAGTTMPLTWIAGRFAMGSRGYLAWLLSRRNPNVRAKGKL